MNGSFELMARSDGFFSDFAVIFILGDKFIGTI